MKIDVPGIISELETLAGKLGFTKGEVWRLAGVNSATVCRLKNGSEAKVDTANKLITARDKLKELQSKKEANNA
jgi:hypothetical protein